MFARLAFTAGRAVERLRAGRSVPAVRNEPLYHGATTGRRARGWTAPTVGPNDAVLWALSLLRARSRQAVRNDGYARMAVDRLVSNIVGAGIAPQSKAPTREFRARLHALWLDWTDQADATGALDFYGLQSQVVRAWLEGSEAFTRLRPRLASDELFVPLQLQVIESEQCPIDYTTVNARTGNRVRAGVEFDAIGRRAAYWFYRQHPGDPQDLNRADLVRVAGDQVAHLYDPLRPGQIRGVPQLTQALIVLQEAGKWRDATQVRQMLSAMYLMFVKRTVPAGDPDLDPRTGLAIERDDQDRALMAMEPGLTQELGPDESVDFSKPPDPTGYADFMRDTLMEASVGAGVPYEVLTGDLRNVNDRTVRVILNEFRRRIEQYQHHIVAFQFNRPIWAAFINRAVLSGALVPPTEFFQDPAPWFRVEWVPPAWPYLHPVQDVDAYKAMVRSGAMTLDEFIREVRGRSLEEVAAERAQELALLDELGIVTDTDPRKTSNAGAPTVAGQDTSTTPP
jgi:lambda family phage portal protein